MALQKKDLYELRAAKDFSEREGKGIARHGPGGYKDIEVRQMITFFKKIGSKIKRFFKALFSRSKEKNDAPPEDFYPLF